MTYTRTKNICDLGIRAQVPRLQRRVLRPARPRGFFKCGRRSNCALCLYSENATSYMCPVTVAVARTTDHITCQNAGEYLLFCKKDTGSCARLSPTYVGICREEDDSSFTQKLAGHLGTASRASQVDKVKTVGCYFRLPRHLVMLPMEVVSPRDLFLLRARATFNIRLFKTQKRMSVFKASALWADAFL